MSLMNGKVILGGFGLMLVQFIYAGYNVYSYSTLAIIPQPVILSMLRNALALPVIFAITFTNAGMPLVEPSDLLRLSFLALFGILGNQLLLLLGLKFEASSPVSAAFMQLFTPIIGTLFAFALRKESLKLLTKFGVFKLLGIILGLAGVLLVLEVDNLASGIFSKNINDQVLAYLCYLGNATCYAFFLLLMKPLLKKYPASRVIFWTLAIGSVFLLLCCIPHLNHESWKNLNGAVWGYFAYSSLVASCVAFAITSWSSQKMSNIAVTSSSVLLPLATYFLDYEFLKVSLRTRDYIGGSLLIAGLVILYFFKYQESLVPVKDYLRIPASGKYDEALFREEYLDEDGMYPIRDQDFESAHSA